MKRLLKYTAILLMVLMSGSSVWAYNYTDHVTTAPNNKGDVLIFPWYLAADAWQTKLTVINTSNTNAVVAKVVIRSFAYSKELLDFLIYLSPADVWTGTMKVVNKTVVIFSDDDSMVYSESPLVFANTTNVNQPMYLSLCPGDADSFGYVEVIMAAYKEGLAPGVSKTRIYAGYKGTTDGTQGAAPADPLTSIGGMYWPYSLAVGNTGNPNSLAGYMEFLNPTYGLSSSLRATTLKDYNIKAKLTTSVETKLGQFSRNTLAEVEAALAKDNLAVPYVNGNNSALHFFTFPTKLTHPDAKCETATVDSPYFYWNANSNWCIEYKATPYDLKENSPASGPYSGGSSHNYFCSEISLVSSSSFPYAEGWTSYAFLNHNTGDFNAAKQDLFYTGVPVIPTYLYIGSLGMEANYGAWNDSQVMGDQGANSNVILNLIDYQYTDSAVATIVVN
jgi:hypothetical protein